MRSQHLVSAVWIVATLGACRTRDPEPASPPSLAQLAERCGTGARVEHATCYELGRRLLAEGRAADAVPELSKACRRLRPACLDLGTIYLEGRPGIPPDHDKAVKYMRTACTGSKKAYDGCGWDALMGLTHHDTGYAYRNALEGQADFACRYGTSGWPCFNYGVGLACGLFGLPDPGAARSPLVRGCRLGDRRACDLDTQLMMDLKPLPDCSAIGPDPEHPVELDLKLTPVPVDADLPPDQEPFRRMPMP